MFCKNCGKKIDDKAEICPKCGVRVQTITKGKYIAPTEPKSKGTAIALAILLGPFTWLYTYKRDGGAFWFGLALHVCLFWTIITPIIVWVCAIIDTSIKSQQWYDEY